VREISADDAFCHWHAQFGAPRNSVISCISETHLPALEACREPRQPPSRQIREPHCQSKSRSLSAKHQGRYTVPWLLSIRCLGPVQIVSPFFHLIGGQPTRNELGCHRGSPAITPCSTTAAFWSPSGIYRQPKPKSGTAPCRTKLTWPHNLNEMASGKPSAVQFSWNSPFGRRYCQCHGFPSNLH
jgi:hypothetical protein